MKKRKKRKTRAKARVRKPVKPTICSDGRVAMTLRLLPALHARLTRVADGRPLNAWISDSIEDRIKKERRR